MKFQRCPICEGFGTMPNYCANTTGALTNICVKCKGEMVIKEPEDEQMPESETVTLYKHLTIAFAVCFFGLIITILVFEHLGLLCK